MSELHSPVRASRREPSQRCAQPLLDAGCSQRAFIAGASKRKHPELGKRRCQTTDVVWITCGNDCGIELKGNGHHERINCMSRRELQSGKHLPGLLRSSAVQLNDANAGIVQQLIDCRVVPDTAADFRQHGRRHPNECTLLVSNS